MKFLTQFSAQVRNIWPGLNKNQKIILISALSIIFLSLLLLVVVVSTIRADYIHLYIKVFPNSSVSEEDCRGLIIIDLNSLLPSPIEVLKEVEEDCKCR